MKNKTHIFTTILLMACLFLNAQTGNPYTVIYESDSNGNRLSGSLEKLLKHVNNGNSLRVGWEINFKNKDSNYVMTHWADAGFVTTLNNHVFAQINSIYSQAHGQPLKMNFLQSYLLAGSLMVGLLL